MLGLIVYVEGSVEDWYDPNRDLTSLNQVIIIIIILINGCIDGELIAAVRISVLFLQQKRVNISGNLLEPYNDQHKIIFQLFSMMSPKWPQTFSKAVVICNYVNEI